MINYLDLKVKLYPLREMSNVTSETLTWKISLFITKCQSYSTMLALLKTMLAETFSYNMALRTSSDVFCEIIHIFWMMRFHGVIQCVPHGEIGHREITYSKLQHIYGILIFVVRNVCFAYLTHDILMIRFLHLSILDTITSFLVFIASINRTITTALNLINFIELPLIFKCLSQFDNSMRAIKRHRLHFYLESLIHIGLGVFLILFTQEAVSNLHLSVLNIFFYTLEFYFDIFMSYLLDVFMINIVRMIKKRFEIINTMFERMYNDCNAISYKLTGIKREREKIEKINKKYLNDLMKLHNLLCETANLTNSFFCVRILLSILGKLIILGSYGHIIFTALYIYKDEFETMKLAVLSIFSVCFCVIPLVKLVSSCSSTSYEVRIDICLYFYCKIIQLIYCR